MQHTDACTQTAILRTAMMSYVHFKRIDDVIDIDTQII